MNPYSSARRGYLQLASPLVLSVVLLAASPLTAAEPATARWPEEQRFFFDDGPGWLLSDEQRSELIAMDEADRLPWMDRFLAQDPVADTEENELATGIGRRRLLIWQEGLVTFLDDRAKVLFLHGAPLEREVIACDQTFVPLEIWRYGPKETTPALILYEPQPDWPYRLWLPMDSKRVLYGHEMEYWLEQVAELIQNGRGPRFDKRLCKQTKAVDLATGIEGLFGFRDKRPTNTQILSWVEAPASLADWASEAVRTPLPEDPGSLVVAAPEVYFPKKEGQRMVARILLRVPEESGLEVHEDNEKTELRIKIDGIVEREGELFENFHIRFQVPVEDRPRELALLMDRLLRPEDEFLVRLRIRDEIGEAEIHRAVGFRVPSEAQAEEDLPSDVVVAHGVDVEPERVPGVDSLVIIPPETDVVLGLWRVETLISGESIQKVIFLLDGKPQMTRGKPPFQAELRLGKYPTEHVVRAEGYDSEGGLIASDEVVLNQQRGRLEVEILEPRKGAVLSGTVNARALVVVPEEANLTRVDFLVNDAVVATLVKPPWQAEIEVPELVQRADISYLTIAAYLDDGTRAEDVRFLSAPEYLEQVEVDLVELYTTVEGDRSLSLQREAFSIFEDGRPQEIAKFELVEDLPITVGITIDTSGSMIESISEAKTAAVDFLERIITPRDQSFAVSFANHPQLLMHRTSDVGAVETAVSSLHAVGNTALYDAVVTSLYYFRGVRGRRALVLLSDGDDTNSNIPFKDSLDYARRSGVAIYAIGLKIGVTSIGIRGKLNDLADETGGRAYFISKASELHSVYGQIERELRSQYLLAYSSDAPSEAEEFRTVEVKVKGKLKARTISGYYP